MGGIIGVTSKSTDTSIRLYKGRSHYNEWAFVYTAPAGAAGGGGPAAPGGAGGRGQRGQGQNPQPNSPFPNTSPFPGRAALLDVATDAVHSARVVLLADPAEVAARHSPSRVVPGADDNLTPG